MEVSGEVADLLVKEGLEVAKIAAEFSAKGIVHAGALLAALVKQNYKITGKVGIDRLLRDSNAESVVIPVKSEDLARFEKIAKQFGVLFATVERGDDNTGVAHIVSNVNYSAQLNAVMEAMGYPVPEAKQEEQAAKKAKSRAPQEKSSNERGNGLNKQTDTIHEKPSTKKRLAVLDAAVKEMRQNTPVRQAEKTR